MISLYVYCIKEIDAEKVTDKIREILVRMGRETLACQVHWSGGSRKDDLAGPVDLMVYEVADEKDFEELFLCRQRFRSADLLILDNGFMSVQDYICPELYPSGLIRHPVSAPRTSRIFEKTIRKIYRDREREYPGWRLWIRSGRERLAVTFSSIYYLEARDKTILLHYEEGVICFRDTLKRLEGILPGYFCRCHKGVIVNFLYVRSINPDTGSIIMKDSAMIPMSRSFWQSLEKKLAGLGGEDNHTFY